MKQKRLIVLLTILALAFTCLAVSVTSFAEETAPTETSVAIGDNTSSTYWDLNTFAGAGNAGAKRTDLRRTELICKGDYGLRFTYMARNLDLRHLKMTVDMTNSPDKHVNMFTFGTYGNYVANNGNKLNIEFLKSVRNKGGVHVVIGKGDSHNISYDFDDFTLDNDETYMGFPVASSIVELEANLVGDKWVVSLNGTEYTIDASVVLGNLGTWGGHSMTFGTMTPTNAVSPVVLSNFEDYNMQQYYAAEGAHGVYLANLEKLEAALETGLTAENLGEVKGYYDAVVAGYGALSYGDNAWYASRNDAATSKYLEQFATLDVNVIIDVCSVDIDAYTEYAIENTEESVLKALNLRTGANSAMNLLNSLTELTEEQAAAVAELNAAVSAKIEGVLAAAEVVVTGQVEAYTAAVAAVTDLETYNAAHAARRAINNSLKGLLAEEKAELLNAAINEAGAELNGKGIELNNFTSSSVNFDKEQGYEYYTNSGNMISKEKVLLTNLELTYTIDSFSPNTGAWFSFGVMEKPQQFSNADDASAAENKGLFTLLTYDAAIKQMKVEFYHMTISCGRFFDAKILETMVFDYELGNDINVRFTTYDETIAGSTSTYLRMLINGKSLAETRLTTRDLNTSLGINASGELLPQEERYRGYLVLATSGGVFTGSIKTVNKADANGETLPADAGAEAYDEVNELLKSLPKASAVTAENLAEVKELVAQIKEKYNALSEEDKAFVTGYNSVASVEAKIASLESQKPDDSTSGNESSGNNGGSDAEIQECSSCGGSATGICGGLVLLGLALVAKKRRA